MHSVRRGFQILVCSPVFLSNSVPNFSKRWQRVFRLVGGFSNLCGTCENVYRLLSLP